MKILKRFIVLLFMLMTTILLTSCEKNLDYQICGYYIELNEVEEISISDKNPKIFFKYDNNNMFSTSAAYGASFVNSAKTIKEEDDVKMFYFTSGLTYSSLYAKSKINVRLILLKDGEYVIDNKIYKTIDENGSCNYSANYNYNGQKYHVEFKLNIKNRE